MKFTISFIALQLGDTVCWYLCDQTVPASIIFRYHTIRTIRFEEFALEELYLSSLFKKIKCQGVDIVLGLPLMTNDKQM